MITEIGITAGDIWHYLDQHHGSAVLSRLCKDIDQPKDLLLMSMGWLAREGHIILSQEGSDYNISLRR